MEVHLRRQSGFLFWFVTLGTFGLSWLLMPLGERHFVRHMDTRGILTRGGRWIGWNDITKIEHARRMMNGDVVSDEYIVRSSRGKASLPTWRAENAREVVAYFAQHLPPAVLTKGVLDVCMGS